MKTTRRILAAIITLALLMSLAACGTKQEAPAAQIPNPMKEVTFDEMVQTAGIPLYAPANAENVRYFTITAGDTVIGQMDFTLDGKAYTYRATTAEMDAAQLSGIYFNAATESYAEVSYAEGKFLTEGNTSVLFWEDKVPGVCYTLSCTECENPIVLLEIAEATFAPVQGDDDGEVTVEYPDLEGDWMDADSSTIELTAAGMQKYDVVIGIFRLAQFTGVGELDTVSMKLTLKDPNGGTMYAEFFGEEDGTGTLVITDSTWNLLNSGTKFTGFFRKPAGSAYFHDPRENPSAMADIVENPDAVYGFSPDPESSRLGAYAEYDWTDPEVVEKGRQDRIAYHESLNGLYAILFEMRSDGASIEEMARAVSAERNRLRLESYRDDPDGLEKVKKSNLETYGDENGPTADSLFEKYGSWETVIQKAFGTNAGMDACVGLYDDYYSLYVELGMIAPEIYEPEYAGVYKRTVREEIGGAVVEKTSYIVLNEDGTGFWVAQDIGMLNWDECQLELTIGAKYDIARAQDNGIEYLLVYESQDAEGVWQPTRFERIEALPAEIAEMLPNF